MQQDLLMSILYELGSRCNIHDLKVKVTGSRWFWAQVDPIANLFRGRCVIKINEVILKLLELGVIDVDTLRGLLAHELGHCVGNKRTKMMSILALIAYSVSVSLTLFLLSGSLDKLVSLLGMSMGFLAYAALMIVSTVLVIRYLPVVFFKQVVRYEEQRADIVATSLVGCEKILYAFRVLASLQGDGAGRNQRFSLIELFVPIRYWMRVIQLDVFKHIENVEKVCRARSDDLGAPLST